MDSIVFKNRKNVQLMIIIISVLSGIIIGYLFFNNTQHNSPSNSWTVSDMRKYASKLKADGLEFQAMRAFEEYLEKSNPDAKTRANIYYSIGEMFLREENYEEALSYFYKAEIADPESDLKQDIGTYIVICLEKMGKSLDAEYQLESRSSLKGEKKHKYASGEIVAKIGSRDITMGELNAEIENLPDWMQEEYRKDESKKLEFLEQYVATDLLYHKGRKLGYTKDPEIREKLELLSKQLIVQKVIEKEVNSKIKVDDADLKNYYEANKEIYKDADGNLKSFDDVKYKVTIAYKNMKSQNLTQNLLKSMLKSKDVFVYYDKFLKKKSVLNKAKDSDKNKTQENLLGEK